MRLALLIILSFLMSLSSTSWADDDSDHDGREGNGGGGVKFEGRIYLLDLFEVGLFEPKITHHPHARDPLLGRARLQSTMERTLAVNMTALRNKLVELAEINPEFAKRLIHDWEQMRWYETPVSIPLTSDYWFLWEYLSPRLGTVKLDEVFVQLAERHKNRVTLAPEAKRDLKPLHYLALIFHEGVSHMYYNLLNHCGVADPTSQTIRRVVALLFSERSEEQKIELTELTRRMMKGDCLLIAESLDRNF